MSLGTVTSTMKRIRTAQWLSPISVFVVNVDGIRTLDALFTNTVEAVRRKTEVKNPRANDEGQTNYAWEWVGDFHWTQSAKAIRNLLKRALEK